MRIRFSHIIIVLTALLIFETVYFFGPAVKLPGKQPSYTITLTKNGFEPSELEISQGDTVYFKTDLAQSFWPASDSHPTHTDYPEFDPLSPITPGETWKFIFDRPGTWAFHNHLRVSDHGQIIVKGSSATDETIGLSWQKQIKTAIKVGGLDAGWAEFVKLSETGAPVVCHWASHLIGEETAKEYEQGRNFNLSDKTSYCGYGFYHGFMETLMRDNPNPSKALAFCDLVGQKLGNNAQDNCFHGVGHGFTEDPPPDNTWGNPDAMLKPGITVCENLFGTTVNKWQICATGVYTVVISFMVEGKYGLSWDKSDPFAFCRTEPAQYYEPCFGEVGPKLDQIVEGNVSEIPALMKKIPNQDLSDLIMRSSVGAMMQRDASLPDQAKYIASCHRVPPSLQSSCIEGVVMGLSLHGEPSKEYVKVLNFCGSKELSNPEAIGCFKSAHAYFGRMYDGQKINDICSSLKAEYRNYCSGQNI